MQILFWLALGWLLNRLWRRFHARRACRESGPCGGAADTGKAAGSAPLSAEPDHPQPFGYKMNWAAVRCQEPERVMAALKPQGRQAANWRTGMAAAYAGRGLFVSPCLDGFVLVVGRDLPAAGMEEPSFSEIQIFCSHRVSSCYSWELYAAGACVRRYAYEDSRVEETGPLTPAEQALGFDRFSGADRESGRVPDEEDVLDLAAAWGIDPRFEKKTYPPSTGWLCTL